MPAVWRRKAGWAHGDRVEVVPVARAPALCVLPWDRSALVRPAKGRSMEFLSSITRLYWGRDCVCRPPSEGTHRGAGVATSEDTPCESG